MGALLGNDDDEGCKVSYGNANTPTINIINTSQTQNHKFVPNMDAKSLKYRAKVEKANKQITAAHTAHAMNVVKQQVKGTVTNVSEKIAKEQTKNALISKAHEYNIRKAESERDAVRRAINGINGS